MSTWETKITRIKPNELLVRGYKLDKLINDNISFSTLIYLVLQNRMPNKAEERLFNAILVSSIDHGTTAPSAVTARSVASCGVPVTTAIAAGITAIGDFHGGAGEKCMLILQDALKSVEEETISNEKFNEIAKTVVTEYRKKKKRIQGFGHRIHTKDPRAMALLKIASEEGLKGKYTKLAIAIQDELNHQTGKTLNLNVDGMIGALLADMGFDPMIAKAIFAISRISGLTAHIHEEVTTQRPMRTIIPKDAVYTGKE